MSDFLTPKVLTGVAALGLFLALLGSRVMLSAVRGGYELLSEATDLQVWGFAGLV